MIHFTTNTFKKVFYLYVSIILFLLVIPLNGNFRLTNVYFGFRSDHIVHCLIFAPFMLLCYLGNIAKTSLKLLIFGFGFASFCEFLHVFIPYRHANIFDLAANYLGITISFLLLKLLKRFRLLPTLDA